MAHDRVGLGSALGCGGAGVTPPPGNRRRRAALLGTCALAALTAPTAAFAQVLLANTSIDSGTTVTVPSVGQPSPWNIGGTLTIGDTGIGGLDVQTGGVVNSAAATLGVSSTGQGNATVGGTGASWNVSGGLTIGAAGQGTLNISQGGVINSTGGLLGNAAGSQGSAIVDGTGSSWIISGQNAALSVGNAGQGSLTVSGGGTVSTFNSFLGQGAASGPGTAVVTGSGSRWDSSNAINIGIAGGSHGSLTVSDGGKVTSVTSQIFNADLTITGAGSRFALTNNIFIWGGSTVTVTDGGGLSSFRGWIGDQVFPGTARVVVSGPKSQWQTKEHLSPAVGTRSILTVGRRSDGELLVEKGARVTGLQSTIGGESGQANAPPGTNVVANGTATVTGAGSAFVFEEGLWVGVTGKGVLTVADGAVVTTGWGNIGQKAGAVGTTTIDGTGSRWDNTTGALVVGDAGTGALAITGGGASSIGGTVGAQGTGLGSVALRGAGSAWNTGTGALVVGDGGTGQVLVDQGAALVTGGGTLGNLAGGVGTVTLTHGGSWTASGPVAIGGAGTGTVNIGAAAGGPAGALGVFDASSVSLGALGRLVFNHTDVSGTYTFAAPITGSGAVDVLAGTTVLTGASTYTGATTVTGGTLVATGSIAGSPVTVGGTGTLAGSGTVGSLAAAAGGTVSPGRSIGTLHVAGDASFAPGSTYRVEIDAAGASDRIAATGKATLTGGTVLIVPAAGTYVERVYPILTATGGVTGTFATLSTPVFAFLDASLRYTPDTVNFVLSKVASFPSEGLTPNQVGSAGGIESLGPDNPLYQAVLVSSPDQARRAFDAASGEIHASVASATFLQDRLVRGTVLDRLRDAPEFCQDEPPARPASSKPAPQAAGAATSAARVPEACDPQQRSFDPHRLALWGQGLGSWGRLSGDGNAATKTTSTGGALFGAEAVLDPVWRLGLAGGYLRSSLQVDDRASSGTIGAFTGALYGGATWNALRLRFGASYSGQSYNTNRAIAFPGFFEKAHASYDGWTGQAFGEIGYAFAIGPGTIEPFAGAALTRLHTNGYAETGGAAALTSAGLDQRLGSTTLGLRAETRLGTTMPLTLRGVLGWQYAFGDVRPTITQSFVSGSQPFAIWGTPVARNALVAEVGLDWALRPDMKVGLVYSGQIASKAQDQAVKGTFTWSF